MPKLTPRLIKKAGEAVGEHLVLHSNWKTILTQAWSVRFVAIAFVLSSLEAALPYLEGYLPVSPQTFSMISAGFAALAVIARLFAQKSLGEEK